MTTNSTSPPPLPFGFGIESFRLLILVGVAGLGRLLVLGIL